MTKTDMSKTILEAIDKEIRIALLKRGFTVPITIEQVGKRLKLSSLPFQTTPVIFQEIRLCDFGSGVAPYVTDGEEQTGILRAHLRVSLRYKHFDGGSNGCDLLLFTCLVRTANDYIFDVRIN